jgi:hypothetical protein
VCVTDVSARVLRDTPADAGLLEDLALLRHLRIRGF